MVNDRQFARGAQRLFRGAIVVGLVALPSLAAAQRSGRGFLFEKPNASFVMRAGYSAANTSGQPFTILAQETTIGPRSFDSFNLGLDLNCFLTRYADLVFTVDVSSRTTSAEYREWEENGRPIVQESQLDRVALGGGFRINLVERGRQISSLAYIPAKILPYIGATGGVMWYEFKQHGDFVEVVDDSTGNIFRDDLRSNHYNVMGQVFGGIERRLNARWSLVGETRWTQSTAKLTNDYAGMGNIQLSGLAFNIGATVRF